MGGWGISSSRAQPARKFGRKIKRIFSETQDESSKPSPKFARRSKIVRPFRGFGRSFATIGQIIERAEKMIIQANFVNKFEDSAFFRKVSVVFCCPPNFIAAWALEETPPAAGAFVDTSYTTTSTTTTTTTTTTTACSMCSATTKTPPSLVSFPSLPC